MKDSRLPHELAERPRILEQELRNIVGNRCPAISWDEGFKAYGCVMDGSVCKYPDRDKCVTYRTRVLPMRKV